MPTAEERAKEQEARALARAGLNPDGTPMNPQGGRRANVVDDADDDDADDDNTDDDPTGRLLGNEGDDDEVSTLRQRLAKMEADLAAANNRAAPEQQRAAEMRDLWQASERERLAHPASPIAPHVTVSIGASATWPSEGGDPEGLLLAADRAMYAAKARGRNCVVASYVG